MLENEELIAAKEIIENTGANLFLTGRAGTGKTTFLRHLRDTTQKRMVIVAPTGIAAINAGGVTIHSFFQLNFSPYLPGIKNEDSAQFKKFSRDKLRVIKGMDLLVIDEISMVRSDLLDAIDNRLKTLRHSSLPFGGVQLLLIGDLAQLAPVTSGSEKDLLAKYYDSPYFFDSHALKQTGFETIELTKVYRQEEGEFLDILDAIRNNTADSELLKTLNSRVISNSLVPGDNVIRLVTHNHQADTINQHMLDALSGECHTFKASLSGNFNEQNLPTDMELSLKLKTQVMFVKNDSSGEKRFYNGKLGIVSGFTEHAIIVTPFDGGENIIVEQEIWQNNKYIVDEETNQLSEEVVGEFKQFPLRKAWAITIHKSQGLTFDNASIDTASAFAHGQTYVGLSRCRSLGGLFLESPIPPQAIITDRVVVNFLSVNSFAPPSEDTIIILKRNFWISLLDSLFNFNETTIALDSLLRTVKSHLQNSFPIAAKEVEEIYNDMRNNLQSVAYRFAKEYRDIIIAENLDGNGHRPTLDSRLFKAADFFLTKIQKYLKIINSVPDFHDNKVVEKTLNSRLDEIKSLLMVKSDILKEIRLKGFTSTIFLNVRTEAELKTVGSSPKRQKKKKSRSESASAAPED
ncbi:MAG: AAA family ATPase [Muribaculaceae bacterium]|nr:AAA family ATPase [Muribaculaceae bacterium]